MEWAELLTPLPRQQKGSPEIPSRDSTLAEALTCIVMALKEIRRASRNQRLPSPCPEQRSALNKPLWRVRKA